MIAYLVERNFPALATVRILVKLATPSDKHRASNLALIAEAEAFALQLKGKSLPELRAMYLEARSTAPPGPAEQKALFEEQNRFFNQPVATADFDHWTKAAHWTLDEAVALSFGKAPEVVRWENVRYYAQVSPFARQYERVRDLTLRAKQWQQLYDPALPGFFLAWAKRTGIAYPEELAQKLAARGQQVADWKTAYDRSQANWAAAGSDDTEIRCHD